MKKQEEHTMTDQIEAILSDIAYDDSEQPTKMIHQLDDEHIQVKSQLYRLVVNYREGFQLEAFEKRYQELFEKYDFIVGDWGFEQLRLRGFYQVNQRKVARDQTILFLDDYLKEYCNFGCQYFVLAKEEALGKYEQSITKQNDKITAPAIDKSTQIPLSTKSEKVKPASRYKKKRPAPRQKKDTETQVTPQEKTGMKTNVKDEFQIKSQAKRPARKPVTAKRETKGIERKEESNTHHSKQRHTTKKGSFVIKQKKKTPE